MAAEVVSECFFFHEDNLVPKQLHIHSYCVLCELLDHFGTAYIVA